MASDLEGEGFAGDASARAGEALRFLAGEPTRLRGGIVGSARRLRTRDRRGDNADRDGAVTSSRLRASSTSGHGIITYVVFRLGVAIKPHIGTGGRTARGVTRRTSQQVSTTSRQGALCTHKSPVHVVVSCSCEQDMISRAHAAATILPRCPVPGSVTVLQTRRLHSLTSCSSPPNAQSLGCAPDFASISSSALSLKPWNL